PDLASGDSIARVAHKRIGQRALATAVRPHNRVNRARLDRQVQAFEDLFVLNIHAQVFDDQIGIHSLSSAHTMHREFMCRESELKFPSPDPWPLNPELQ